ncbi:MAG: autotransporter outer membrane beta-barrel domain-containing protein [Rickettsiales bacterium]
MILSIYQKKKLILAIILFSLGSHTITSNAQIIGGGGSSLLPAVQAIGNSPAYGAATVIDANSNLSDLFSSISGNANLSAAATETLPILTGGSAMAVGNSLSNMNNIIQSRLSQTNFADDVNKASVDKRFWVQPFRGWTKQGNVGPVQGYKTDNAGVLVGMDRNVKDNLRLGFAVGYSKSNVGANPATARHHMDVATHQLIGYGGYKVNNNTEVTFQIDGGYNNTKGRRSISSQSTTALSDFDSYNGHAGVGIAKNIKLNNKFSLTPSAKADYTYIQEKSYNETGASLLNLLVKKNSRQELLTSANTRLDYSINKASKLFVNAGIAYDAINDRAKVTSAFSGASGSNFNTNGLKQKPWIGRAGLGVKYTPKTGLDIYGSYDAELRNKYSNQTLSAVLRIKF